MSRVAAAASVLLVLALGATGCGSKGNEAGGPSSKPGATSAAPAAHMESLDEHCPSPNASISFPPDGKLVAAGVVGVRLCNAEEKFKGGVQYDVAPPGDELTAGVDKLVSLVNNAPPVKADSCFSDQGPDLVFWFRYKDGTARSVVDQRYGCRPLLVGPGQTVGAGDALYTGFLDALAAQRAAKRTPSARGSSPSCDPTQPVTPLDLSRTLGLATAALCLDAGNGQWKERILNAAQIAQVNNDYRAHFNPGQGNGCAATPRWLVGTNPWGDTILLKGTKSGCAFLVPAVVVQETGFFWTPSTKVERMLDGLRGPG